MFVSIWEKLGERKSLYHHFVNACEIFQEGDSKMNRTGQLGKLIAAEQPEFWFEILLLNNICFTKAYFKINLDYKKLVP